MNVQTIVTSNTKGQVVIPHMIRKRLGIVPNTLLQVTQVGEDILLRPVKRIITQTKSDNQALLEVLKRTAGAWAGDDWPETEKKMRRVELAATRKRRAATW